MDAVLELRYALDTFYFLITGALVMWMGAGFAMLEAGLVRAKNTAEILTKNIVLYAIACIMYMIIGYNLMYPADGNGIIPGFSLFLGADHDPSAVLATGADGWYDGDYYSARSDFFFQVVFVATAMSIVSGAVAERMKLWAFLIFCVVMTGFIYPIEGYWKWGGGWLDANGFLDFAGSGVVHLCGASAALAGVLLLGARKGKYGPDGQINAIPGANLPLATLGTFILWLGWFGFNGGSELVVSNIAEANAVANVFVNTNAAAAGGCVAALAGLVAITAEPLTPTPGWATVIGIIGGLIVVIAIISIDKIKIDDPVGAISVHGVVGMWGLLAVPITNTDGSFGAQLMGLLAILIWTFVTSFITWFIIKMVMGIRVSEEEEYEGVDLSECGLEAYPEFGASTTK